MFCAVVSSTQSLIVMLETGIEVVPLFVTWKKSCTWFATQEAVSTWSCKFAELVRSSPTEPVRSSGAVVVAVDRDPAGPGSVELQPAAEPARTQPAARATRLTNARLWRTIERTLPPEDRATRAPCTRTADERDGHRCMGATLSS